MNRDLFWKLLKQEHAGAEAFCRRLAGARDDGDDLYHDCLIRAWRGFPRLRDHASFRPWLYRIIVNQFKSRKRSPWWSRRISLRESGAGEHLVYEQMPELDTRRTLDRLLETLSPEDRALVVLFELEGWTIRELAVMHGKSEGTIKSRLSRSRDKMRKKLARKISTANKHQAKEGGAICVAGKPGSE